MTGNRFDTNHRQRGFTLIEILVVLAVFSITIMIVVEIFLTVGGLQRRMISIQRTQSDARYVMELIAGDFKNGTIDYKYYDNSPTESLAPEHQPLKVLVIRDRFGNQVRYREYNDSGTIKIQVCTCTVEDDALCPNPDDWVDPLGCRNQSGAYTWSDITPIDVKVNSLSFYLSPATSPFVVNGPNEQPRATIVMESETKRFSTGGTEKINIQTTVTSRYYQR